MEFQLSESKIPTNFIKNIDLSWALEDLTSLIKQHSNRDYILIFPFCSKKHLNKKWPFFKELIIKIRREYKNNYSIFIAPGPNELQDAKEYSANIILNENKPLGIKKLVSLIDNANKDLE